MTWYVLLADSTKARIFRVEPAEARGESTLRLNERVSLTDPEMHLRPSEALSDSNPTGHSAPGGGPAHTYDDHRERHRQEGVRRFAREIAGAARSECEAGEATSLIVGASPAVLGLLRHELERELPVGISTRYVERNLSKKTAPEVQSYLQAEGLLPSR